MTYFMCHCGKAHDNVVQGYCAVTVTLAAASGVNVSLAEWNRLVELRDAAIACRRNEKAIDAAVASKDHDAWNRETATLGDVIDRLNRAIDAVLT